MFNNKPRHSQCQNTNSNKNAISSKQPLKDITIIQQNLTNNNEANLKSLDQRSSIINYSNGSYFKAKTKISDYNQNTKSLLGLQLMGESKILQDDQNDNYINSYRRKPKIVKSNIKYIENVYYNNILQTNFVNNNSSNHNRGSIFTEAQITISSQLQSQLQLQTNNVSTITQNKQTEYQLNQYRIFRNQNLQKYKPENQEKGLRFSITRSKENIKHKQNQLPQEMYICLSKGKRQPKNGVSLREKIQQRLKNPDPSSQAKSKNNQIFIKKQGKQNKTTSRLKTQQILQKSQVFNNLNFQQRQSQILLRKKTQVIKLKTQYQQRVQQECSFTPKLNKWKGPQKKCQAQNKDDSQLALEQKVNKSCSSRRETVKRNRISKKIDAKIV